MRYFLTLTVFFWSAFGFANARSFPTPKTLEGMKHPVIFYSPNIHPAGKTPDESFFKRTALRRWGTQVFEKLVIVYSCSNKQARCQISEYKTLAFYQQCSVTDQAVRCSQKITSSEPPSQSIGRERDSHLDNRFHEREENQDPAGFNESEERDSHLDAPAAPYQQDDPDRAG